MIVTNTLLNSERVRPIYQQSRGKLGIRARFTDSGVYQGLFGTFRDPGFHSKSLEADRRVLLNIEGEVSIQS